MGWAIEVQYYSEVHMIKDLRRLFTLWMHTDQSFWTYKACGFREIATWVRTVFYHPTS